MFGCETWISFWPEILPKSSWPFNLSVATYFLGNVDFVTMRYILLQKLKLQFCTSQEADQKWEAVMAQNRWENLSQCVSHHSCCCCAGAREAIWQNYSWMLPPPPILIQIQIQIQIDVVLGQERQDYSRKPPTDRAAFVPWPESWVQQWIRRGFV